MVNDLSLARIRIAEDDPPVIAPLAAMLISGAAAAPERRSCLKGLAPKQQGVSEYDRQHDYVPDFSYSCLYGMTASEVRRDLVEIQGAAAEPGCSALRAVLVYPFGISQANGSYVELRRSQVCKYAPLAGDLQPDQLSSAGWRGLFTRDQSIWLNTVKNKEGTLHLRLVRVGLDKASHDHPKR